MGAQIDSVRVVLDTNVLVSALLFGGNPDKVRLLWKSGRIVPLMSRETVTEFRAVLSYPKFKLTKREIGAILNDEILPYCVPVEIVTPVAGICRDPHDDMFLAVAMNGNASYVVSGDQDLLSLKAFQQTQIVTVAVFLELAS